MATFILQISTSLLIFLFAATFGLSMSSDHKVVRCDETDRRTLLIFKQGIIDPLNQLSTWSNVTDCCAWNGVECHNTTGRVIKLDLFDLFLKGEIPMDLSNWTRLWFLNLGKNKISGTIPIKMPQNLQVMILRSNQFEGNIPPQIFNLSFLGHLDLAHNKLSGYIPHSAYNITQMIADKINGWLPSSIDLYTKGQYYEPYMDPERRTIDVSVNNLSGEIPLQLFGLIQLQTLNLSHNHFNGRIDETIGNMKNLESLDFSNNNLSGEIPRSMAGLSFLGYLNLSCNNFIGQIPSGTQLQGFDASSYVGNTKLCGPPLAKCIINKENPGNAKQGVGNDGDNLVRNSLYLGMGVGFAVSFWGVCGSLILIRKWRHSYYQFLDQIADKFYVTLTVMINDLRKSEATTS